MSTRFSRLQAAVNGISRVVSAAAQVLTEDRLQEVYLFEVLCLAEDEKQLNNPDTITARHLSSDKRQ